VLLISCAARHVSIDGREVAVQTMEPQDHDQVYDKILAVAMRYSTVVNYGRIVVVLLFPRHFVLSSSSASTSHSYQVVGDLFTSTFCFLGVDG
jgi:hypothetical protein